MNNNIKILILYENLEHSMPIEYTFNVILSTLDVNYEILPYSKNLTRQIDFDLLVSYGKHLPDIEYKKSIHIFESYLLWTNYLSSDSIPKTPVVMYKNLPVIYVGAGEKHPELTKHENTIITNIDIIASSFFMLSRYEEVVIQDRDEHNRFPASSSIAGKSDFLDRPIVNEYIELLRIWIKEIGLKTPDKPLWKSNKSCSVCLTHDIDYVKKNSIKPPARAIGRLLFKQRDLKAAIDRILEYSATVLKLKNDPYDTFDYLIDLEEKYGFTSSFYFLLEDAHKDKYLDISITSLKNLLEKIENRQCEIGLHGSYESYINEDNLIEERSTLSKYTSTEITGIRQHYLRFKAPDTWRIQSKAGFHYDTTLAFAEKCGFRAGFCFPYKPFDLFNNKVLDIWELPLVVMDSSLKGLNYQNLQPNEALDYVIRLFDITVRYNGCLVFLWHNTSFDLLAGWNKGWQDIYEKIIEYFKTKNCWVTTGKEIIELWENYYGRY